MQAQKKIVARTLLTLLPQMNDFVDHISKKSNSLVSASFHSTMNAKVIYERILDNIVRKDKIVDLRKRVRSLIKSLPRKFALILWEHYMKKQSFTQIAEVQNVTTRTIERRVAKAVELFAQNLDSICINNFTFGSLVREFRWIKAELASQMQLT